MNTPFLPPPTPLSALAALVRSLGGRVNDEGDHVVCVRADGTGRVLRYQCGNTADRAAAMRTVILLVYPDHVWRGEGDA